MGYIAFCIFGIFSFVFLIYLQYWMHKRNVRNARTEKEDMQLKMYGGTCDVIDANVEHCMKLNRGLDKINGGGCESCPGWTPGEV